MDDIREVNLRLYESIVEEHIDINAWTSNNCFDIKKLSLLEQDKLSFFNVVEIVFPGNFGDKDISESVFERFQKFVEQYVLNIQSPKYIVKFDYREILKNRIRTYKGIIPRDIDETKYIELEIDTSNNHSIIVGIVKLDEVNLNLMFNSIFDSSNCFIMSTLEEVFSLNFLKKIFEKYLIVDNRVYINYLKLVIYELNGNDLILRTGGDGGDAEIGLQIFATSTYTKEILNEPILDHSSLKLF